MHKVVYVLGSFGAWQPLIQKDITMRCHSGK